MLMEQMPLLELLWNLISRKTENVSKVRYFPQKTAFQDEINISAPFPRTTPESQGVSSDLCRNLLQELSLGKHTYMHQIMMLRHGNVIMECGFAPYRTNLWHATYSLCKSITGLAIGMMIEEEKLSLDDRVITLFPGHKNIMTLLRQRDLTIEHLLTMSSGSAFNESGAVSGNEWVKSFLESSLHFTPGTQFEYNSMNSYMLSAIVTEITGETMMEYLRPRLWEPLGIQQIFWETCPNGITKGGWGLFLCPEDAAKIGQLYLQKGKWNDRQIISEEWIDMSVKGHIAVPEEMGFGGYGYHIWEGQRPGSFVFNGMLGQNVLVYPDLDIVVVTNAGNSVLFQKCEMLDILNKYLGDINLPNDSLAENPSAFKKLQKQKYRLEHSVPMFRPSKYRLFSRIRLQKEQKKTKKLFDRLCSNVYEMKDKSIGVFPLALQVFHNNFTDGVSKIGFQKEDKNDVIIIEEGNTVHTLKAGRNEWIENHIYFHEEPYKIAVCISQATDEDEHPVLKIELAFLEDAARRTLKIIFTDDTLNQCIVRWNEFPGKTMIMEGLESMTNSLTDIPILKGMKENGIQNIMEMLLNQTIEPETTGDLIDEQ